MLKGIPSCISPELLKILAEMGHGDQITIGDAYFPAASLAADHKAVRADGISAATLLNAVLQLFPLDHWEKQSVTVMGKTIEDETMELAPKTRELISIVESFDAQAAKDVRIADRFAFYEHTRRSYAVVSTGELENYGCIILQKGTE